MALEGRIDPAIRVTSHLEASRPVVGLARRPRGRVANGDRASCEVVSQLGALPSERCWRPEFTAGYGSSAACLDALAVGVKQLIDLGVVSDRTFARCSGRLA